MSAFSDESSAETPSKEGKTLHQLALNAQKEGNSDSACVIWRGILARQPDDIIAANNFAVLLRKLGRLAESEAILRQAIAHHPKVWTLWYALGTTLTAWDNREEALSAYVSALEFAPEEPSVHYAIGKLLLGDNQLVDAVFHFRETIRCAPRHAPAHVGAGRALIMLEELQEAELLLIRATELDPFDANAHYTLANLWLLQQNARRGWQAYEWRFRAGIPVVAPQVDIWQGEPLRSRVLLIVAEQRNAYTLFFLRFLQHLPNFQIILKCKKELIPLLRSSGFVKHFWPSNSPTPPPDTPTPQCWCPLGSLPLLINQHSSPQFLNVPYLRADPSEIPLWQQQFKKRPSIGLAWKSSDPFLGDKPREFPLQTFQELLLLRNVDFVALHPDLNQEEKQWLHQHRIHCLDDNFDPEGGFVNAAALMEALSLVVTPGGVFAHLAGALARPAFVITPAFSEWVWKHHNGDAYWYPSVEVYPYTYDQSPEQAVSRIYQQLREIQRV